MFLNSAQINFIPHNLIPIRNRKIILHNLILVHKSKLFSETKTVDLDSSSLQFEIKFNRVGVLHPHLEISDDYRVGVHFLFLFRPFQIIDSIRISWLQQYEWRCSNSSCLEAKLNEEENQSRRALCEPIIFSPRRLLFVARHIFVLENMKLASKWLMSLKIHLVPNNNNKISVFKL